MATNSIIKLIVQKDSSVKASIKDLKAIQKLVDDINKKGIQLSKAKGTETAKLTTQITQQTKELGKQIKLKRKNADLTDAELKDKIRIQEIDRARVREIRKQVKAQSGLTKNTNTWGNAMNSHMFKFNALGNIAANVVSRITSGFSRMVKMGFEIFVEFESTMSRVKAITGATDEEFKLLEADARRLGETTEKTASQVGQLQVEYAKLGFTTQEILNATEATLNLSTATGSDLAQAAQVAGATIRGFGLDASDTGRVTDVMTKSFNSSALDMDKFSTAMSKVAPVSRAFGFSLEDSTSLLAKLSDAGFDASTAATSTRSILLNLADANGKLAKELGRPVKTLPDLVAGLKELDERGIDLASSLELTDKRSVAAFQTFLKGADSLGTFSEALKDSAGEAQRTADIMRDNLKGDMDKAKSAIEGLVISLGKKLAPVMRQTIQGFTKLLGWVNKNTKIIKFFGKVIATATSFLVGYKLGVILAKFWTEKLSKATWKATFSIKAFSKAIKLNPLGFLFGAIMAVVTALGLFRDETEDSTDAEKDLNDELERGNELLDERAKKLFNLENVFIKRGTNLKNLVKDYDAVLDIVKKEIGFEKVRLEVLKDYIETRKLALRQQLLEAESKLVKIGDEILTLNGYKIATQKDVDRLKRQLSIFTDEIEANEKLLVVVNERISLLTKEKEKEKDIKKTIEETNETKGRIAKLNLAISRQQQLIREAEGENAKETIKEAQLQIEKLQQIKNELLGVEVAIEKVDKKTEEATGKFTKYTDEQIEALKKSSLDEFWEENKDELLADTKDFADTIIKEWDRVLDERGKMLEEETEKHKTEVEKQEQRAMLGQENTLAFEKEMLAKKEAEQIRHKKEEEKQAKLMAWYNIVANSETMTDAFKKLAMMEVAAALFEDGGVVEDNLPKDGIFRGKSHKGGGIPIIVEGKEGIFSKNEMANLGKDNFYSLKNMLGSGKMSADLFERQHQLIPYAKIVETNNNQQIVNEIKDLKNTIKNKREYVVNWDNEGNRIEQIKEHNRITINKYVNSRPRI